MKIIDGIKNQGRPFKIPDCGRDDLPQFFVEMGFKVGTEVGVYKGEFTTKLCAAGLKVYGVDPWLFYPDYVHPKGQERQNFLYGHAQRELAKYPDCTLIRKTSMDAAKDFDDESLDFVYIDGHHHFKFVTEDIFEWSKKVKKGGVISGHDYANKDKDPKDPFTLHVKYVVDAYTQACKIDNWFVLGDDTGKRDRWRSWLWLKT